MADPGPVPTIQRLEWDRPALPQAASIVAALATRDRDGLLDLSRVVCVTPGARAGRLLLAHLVDSASRGPGDGGEDGVEVDAVASVRPPMPPPMPPPVPPLVTTPGALLGALLHPGAMAGRLERHAAWISELESLRGSDASVLLGAEEAGLDGAADRWRAWEPLAEALQRTEDELAAWGIAPAEAAAEAGRLGGARERRRWEVIVRIATRVSARLRAAGLADRTSAWCRALEAPIEPGAMAGRRIVLVCTVELNAMHRGAVERFRREGGAVHALVHAPSDAIGAFDELGVLRRGAWSDRRLAIEDEVLVIADRMDDAAQATLDEIADLDGRCSAEEVTVGLADGSLGSVLRDAGAWAGVDVHLPDGRAVRTTEIGRLLRALADEASDPARAAAALVRLPAAEAWIRTRLDVPNEELDLPAALDRAAAADRPGGRPPRTTVSGDAERLLEEVLQPLAATRSLRDWAPPLRALLGAMVEHAEPTADAEAAAAAVGEALAAWETLPPTLQRAVTGVDALRLLARWTADERTPQPRERGQLEALGWLELHLDDAPVLVLCGLHEGAVPAALGADPLLPGSLRSALGMPDEARRVERDAYLLAAMLRGRDRVRCVIARRTLDGDPVQASRLLLMGDPARLPARLQRLTDGGACRAAVAPRGLPEPGMGGFVRPTATPPVETIDRLRVTAFRDYLACPYRFWLRHVVGLEEVEPPDEPLSPPEFGMLAHDVLQAFGESEVRGSDDPARIGEFLNEVLRTTVDEQFGCTPPPVVMVQVARLQTRLETFAARQAAHRREGWRIVRSESALPSDAALDVDGVPMRVTGRIDRIDVHEVDGRWLILDYKTGESGRTPDRTHRSGGEWTDLQLPLYAHLAAPPEGAVGRPETGYALLPRAATRAGIVRSGWNEAAHAEAIECAQAVVRSIRDGAFPINEQFQSGFDQFAAICQTRALGLDDAVDGVGEGHDP